MLLVFASVLATACRGEPTAVRDEAHADRDPGTTTSAPAASVPDGALLAATPRAGTAPAAASAAPEAPPCPTGKVCDYAAFDAVPRPVITAVYAEKRAHRLHLLSEGRVVKSYTIALGWGGEGPKQREGDGVTPTGTYQLTGTLATSPWHTLIGISYPNYDDVLRHARLKAEGRIPFDAHIGFGIALHGRAARHADGEHKASDWTAGCIAVDNPEIEEIASLVKKGTPITIVD